MMARGFPPWHTVVMTRLRRDVLTFCVRSMPANVTIEVNGRRWQRVMSLAKSRPDDRHYVLKTTGDRATVIFGDGEHGTAHLQVRPCKRPIGRDQVEQVKSN